MKFIKGKFLYLFVFQMLVCFLSAQTTVDFRVTTLNAEWLTCADYGPTNEDLQLNNLVTVIKSLNSDIIALQEVGTSTSFMTIDTIVKRLGDVWSGNIVPWSNDNCSQNQALIYKKNKIQVINSSLVKNGGSYYNWSSGRYPVLFNLNFVVGSSVIPVSLVNIHAKAYNDENSYAKRLAASEGLKILLDGSSYLNKKVVLLGDYNDYLIGTQCSTCQTTDSPYKNFMDDNVNYKGLTYNLTDSYYNTPLIDNIIISNELFGNYVNNSVKRETTATQSVSAYYSTTTDHTPISVTLRFTMGIDGLEEHCQENEPKVILLADNINLKIISQSSVRRVSIYSLTGKLVSLIEQNTTLINISNIPKGIYFVHLQTDNRNYIVKILL